MAFKKKPENKKFVFKPKSNVVVRKGYYTFSKQYPAEKIGKIKFKSKTRYKTKHLVIKRSLIALSLVSLFALSYFVSCLAYDFSYKSLDLVSTTDSLDVGQDAVSFLAENEIKALYLPSDKLADSDYIEDLIKQINYKNANSVIIDFKTSSGDLLYNSSNSYALTAKAAIYDSRTMREAIDLFEDADIEVIASIYCFEDDLIATTYTDLAVKYMNTTVNWLDDLSENGGRSWLNPYSDQAVSYLEDIIKEVCSFDISGVILQSVQYPNGLAIDNATYIGESSLDTRNQVLLDFISSVNDLIANDKFLLVAQDVSAMLGAEQSIYYGTLNAAQVDGFVYDTSDREEIYTIDSLNDYAAFKSMLAQIDAINGGVYSIAMYQEEEYSWWFFHSLSGDGYDSFVIY